MLAASATPPVADASSEVVHAAFRDLHGRRLHGFALLLMLGDAARAAQLAVDALDAGSTRIDELRHPERAAAWLRARVVASSRGMPRAGRRVQPLSDLGVDASVASALGTLGHLERAALIASSIERLDRRDVATVVGRHGDALDRLLAHARRGYGAAHAEGNPSEDVPVGPLVERVHAEADRAMR
jgi:DNA-directed RNA polymerase specialized sigma24 family protein